MTIQPAHCTPPIHKQCLGMQPLPNRFNTKLPEMCGIFSQVVEIVNLKAYRLVLRLAKLLYVQHFLRLRPEVLLLHLFIM